MVDTPPAAVPFRTNVLEALYAQISSLVSPLDAREFLRPTRADAWCVQDLLFHLLLDAQRALIAFATPTSHEPDVDGVSYWEAFRPDHGDRGVANARFVRIAASAYAPPTWLTEQWAETSTAAVRAANRAASSSRVVTQHHVLTVADFVDTLIVEATVHYLDMTANLAGPPVPSEALSLTRSVLDGLLGYVVRVDWTDTEYVLKGTGRLPLTPDDVGSLGASADRLPLFG
jgi:hypothetical protein